MKTEAENTYLQKSTFWLGMACLVLLTPFSINNFLQGRYVLGAGSMVVIFIVSLNAWLIRQNRSYHLITLLGLVPAIIFFLVISIRKQGVIGVLWCYPAVIAFYMMLPEKKAWIANIALIVISIPVAWYVIDSPVATRMIATLLTVSIFSAIFTRVITSQQSRLQALAETDPLTGLLNRNLLQTSLEESIQQNIRSGEQYTLITMDIDNFKIINDTYGHDAGDMVLRSIADIILKRLRRVDKVYRLGGEEFLALLRGTDESNAAEIAESLKAAISSETMILDESITVSMGVAGYRSDESWLDWMKRSDEKLYRAKVEGRNRVVV